MSDYIVFLRFEHYQRKSDEKFKELLRLEDLLEKCNTETKPTKEDQKIIKKKSDGLNIVFPVWMKNIQLMEK